MRRKLVVAALVTALFGIAFAVMYLLWARFEPVYFFTALAVYLVLLALALVFVGRKPKDLDAEVERDLDEASSSAGQVSPATGALRAPVAVLDTPEGLPIQVEKATGMSPMSVTEPAVPTGYTLRGFALYERAGKDGPVRFFTRGRPVGGGQPVSLPTGFEARWDNKKKRPYLEEIPAPKPSEPAEPEEEAFVVSKPTARMPTGVATRKAQVEPEAPTTPAHARPCAAFTSPGIMCSRPARAESPYCGAHAKYRPESTLQGFEVEHDRGGTKNKPFRGGMGEFEVRVARPHAKPLRFKAPSVEVKLARPSTHPAPPTKGKRAPPPAAPKANKPLKNIAERPFQVRVAKPTVKPLRVTGLGIMQARLAKPKAPKPLRIPPPSTLTVRTARPNARPIKLKASREPVVRTGASLADAKPLRLRTQDAFDVSTARGSLMASSNRKVRCKAALKNGRRCSNDAIGGAQYCRQHKDFKPRIEALVVRDTRARNPAGVGDQDRVPKRRGR